MGGGPVAYLTPRSMGVHGLVTGRYGALDARLAVDSKGNVGAEAGVAYSGPDGRLRAGAGVERVAGEKPKATASVQAQMNATKDVAAFAEVRGSQGSVTGAVGVKLTF